MVGKEKKAKKPRHSPLEVQIRESETVKGRPIGTRKKKEKEEKDAEFIGKNLSKKILSQARDQMFEENEVGKVTSQPKRQAEIHFQHRQSKDDFSDEEYEEGEFEVEELEKITEEDEKALEMFMSKEPSKKLTLADIVMEKIKQNEESMSVDLDERLAKSIDPKVLEVYKSVGKLLSHYTSGKVPKAFKILPVLSNWEELMYVTKPEEWSPAAVLQATRIFASNLNAKLAQRFFNLVLLPRIREEFQSHKHLNHHLYTALKKALYKPAAFYKGILLPLCEDRDCTLREATIISSILHKASIPVLHSSAAIMKIAEMNYSGANSIFLRVLFNKKYALPYKVIDSVVEHFMKFAKDERTMPVLWHETLLTFVQRYKQDLTTKQKENLKFLVKKQEHKYFSDEIRRELQHSASRGEETQAMDFNMEDVVDDQDELEMELL